MHKAKHVSVRERLRRLRDRANAHLSEPMRRSTYQMFSEEWTIHEQMTGWHSPSLLVKPRYRSWRTRADVRTQD